MNRRHFLSLLPILGGAGCMQSSEDARARIETVKITNFDDTPHSVQFLMERDDEVVLWETKRVPAAEYGQTVRAGFKYVSNIPRKSGKYTIRVRVDDSESIASLKTADLSNQVDCVNVEAEIDDEGDVELLHTFGCPDS